MATHKGYKGIFVPKNPKKYKGNINNIIFRSLLERQYMVLFDTNPNIIEWSSEETIVPYKSIDGKMHRYFVDFTIKTADNQKYLIEIKPLKFTQEPKKRKRITESYREEWMEYNKNRLKWAYATEFARKNNAYFCILTEEDIAKWR